MILTPLFAGILALASLGHTDRMQRLINGEIHDFSSGTVEVELFVVDKFQHRIEFPHFTYFAENNYRTVQEAIHLLADARKPGAFGDYMYLWSFAKRQGNITLDFDSYFVRDLTMVGTKDAVLPLLIFTTSNSELRSFYTNLILLESLGWRESEEFEFVNQRNGMAG